jgi:hypothetical protein
LNRQMLQQAIIDNLLFDSEDEGGLIKKISGYDLMKIKRS